MATSRSDRTGVTTSRTGRPLFKVLIDYLFGNNGGSNQIVEDETGEQISIYANSGYQEVDSGTQRNDRTPI